MFSEEEVQIPGLVCQKSVGPPLVEGGHCEGVESPLDQDLATEEDLIEDLILDEDVEPSAAFGDEHPKARPLNREFLASVQKYVSGLSDCRSSKPRPAALTDDLRDQKVFDSFFWSNEIRRLREVSLPEVLGKNMSEPPVIMKDYSKRWKRDERYQVRWFSSITVRYDHGWPRKILFLTVLRNSNFFLRLSDPGSYEHKKSLFLWKTVSSLRPRMLNTRRLRAVLEEVRTYALQLGNERMVRQFDGKLAQVSEQERELFALLGETRWTEYFLASTKESNVLAQQIWRALRGVPVGLSEDVLEELRTRFKRGRIWENDPWWPT